MGLRTTVVAMVCALLGAAGCGLALDYDAPERSRDGGGLDAGGSGLDAARVDAARDDDAGGGRDDASVAPDGSVSSDATSVGDAAVVCPGCTLGYCVHGCDGAFHCVPNDVCSTGDVCGCDGTVYASDCEAWGHGVDVDPSSSRCGVCNDTSDCVAGQFCGGCGTLRYCVDEPTCSSEPGPVVCGCDRVTYASPCAAAAAGVARTTLGGCSGEDCVDSLDCADREYCRRAECGDAVGRCTALPPTTLLACGGCSGAPYLTSDGALRREGVLADVCGACATPQAGCCRAARDCEASETCVLDALCHGVCEPPCSRPGSAGATTTATSGTSARAPRCARAARPASARTFRARA